MAHWCLELFLVSHQDWTQLETIDQGCACMRMCSRCTRAARTSYSLLRGCTIGNSVGQRKRLPYTVLDRDDEYRRSAAGGRKIRPIWGLFSPIAIALTWEVFDAGDPLKVWYAALCDANHMHGVVQEFESRKGPALAAHSDPLRWLCLSTVAAQRASS